MSTAVPTGTHRDAFKRVAADKAMEDATGRPIIAHGGTPPTARSRRPHIVIIGAGFGGLSAATGLGRAAAVTVIDQRNHHLFQPLLYQVATAALSPADIAAPIRGILSRQTDWLWSYLTYQRGARLITGHDNVTDAISIASKR
jgi:NADPH-dependent 2,4-dienoyl-CoA reductase/sulfur reductase-like enzyme